jgi:hypothetical protein
VSETLCIHDMVPRDCADCRPRHAITAGPKGGWYGTDRYQLGPESNWPALAEQAAVAAEAEAQADMGPEIEARYSGTCRGCGQRWDPGEYIRFSEDEGAWLCAVCGSDDE